MKNEKQNRISQDPSKPRKIVLNHELDSLEEYYYEDNNFITERLHRKVHSERNWFEKIITHNPSIGSFYETLIRNTIREIAPSNNTVTTGFIYDSERNKHGKQIDVMVYDGTDRNVILKSEDFSIVYPGSIIAISEIKKSLTNQNVKKVINSTFFNSLGSYREDIYGVQKLNIFGFELKNKIDRFFHSVCDEIEKCVHELVNPQGITPVSTIVLPQVYFLDEPYIIETKIKQKEGIAFEISVDLHKTNKYQSFGNYIVEMIRENKTKKSRFESNYLSSNIREMPIKSKIIKESILLYKKISFSECVKLFNLDKEGVKKTHFEDFKIISIKVPITLDFKKINKLNDLLTNESTLIEYMNIKTGKISLKKGNN